MRSLWLIVGIAALAGPCAQQPVATATGCENTEPSFRQRHREQRRLAHVSVFSDTPGEFSVASQALQRFTTACQAQSPTELEYRQELLIQIGVANLDRAIAFYTKTLGFEVTERRADLKFAHIQTNVPGLEIGVNEVGKPRGSGGIVLNIGVVDVAAARRALEARGVVFTAETVVIPGKVALAPFADPDGNVLRLAGPPPKMH